MYVVTMLIKIHNQLQQWLTDPLVVQEQKELLSVHTRFNFFIFECEDCVTLYT